MGGQEGPRRGGEGGSSRYNRELCSAAKCGVKSDSWGGRRQAVFRPCSAERCCAELNWKHLKDPPWVAGSSRLSRLKNIPTCRRAGRNCCFLQPDSFVRQSPCSSVYLARWGGLMGRVVAWMPRDQRSATDLTWDHGKSLHPPAGFCVLVPQALSLGREAVWDAYPQCCLG